MLRRGHRGPFHPGQVLQHEENVHSNKRRDRPVAPILYGFAHAGPLHGPDSKYYHIVAEGQNPTWIAQYYGITLADLIAWNGGNEARVWYPGEKMLLEVTPPPTLTPTLAPPTATPIPSLTPTQTGTPQPTATIDLTPLAQAVLEQERAEGKNRI